MKSMTIAALLSAPFFVPASASALSSARAGAPGITTPVTVPSHNLRRHEAVLALREEGLKLQVADGGTLTDAHRAYLQAKYDAIRAGNY